MYTGAPGHLGQADDAVGGLALEHRRARRAVVVGIGVAGGDVLSCHHVDGQAVLGVHHDQPAVLRGLLHRPEDRAVIAEEDARVGGEQLEGGHALVDQGVHLGQDVVADVADDHVEAVVDAGLAIGLLVPGVEPVAQRPAARLHGEVDDRGGAAEGGGARPGLEGVLGERAAEGQLHVGVHVDRAGDDPLARRVDGRDRPCRPGRCRSGRSSRRRPARRPGWWRRR